MIAKYCLIGLFLGLTLSLFLFVSFWQTSDKWRAKYVMIRLKLLINARRVIHPLVALNLPHPLFTPVLKNRKNKMKLFLSTLLFSGGEAASDANTAERVRD